MSRQKASPPHRDRAPLKVQQHKRLYFAHSDNMRETGLLCTDTARAERIRNVQEALYEVNKRVPIIVEGKRDVRALRRLGMVGDIFAVHSGRGLYDFCEDIAERFHRAVLLLDWDDKGEALFRNLSVHLRGLWEEFSSFREIVKLLCQKDIKDIEGIPGLLERLAGTEVSVGEVEDLIV
jgi:5S rRNA maturation endonuclease (ribonuclease M5)